MNNLIEVKNTMTSLEIAEITNKNHRDVLRDIRDESEKLGEEITERIFALSEYKDSTGRNLPMFILTVEGVIQLAARYSATTRYKLIQKVKHKQITVPTTFKEALKLAYEQAEQIELLESENKIKEQIIEEFKPMKDYLDKILKDSESTLTITQIAADYGLSARALNTILHEQGLIRKVNDQWILYSEHMNKGYTKSQTIEVPRKDGSMKTIINTKWLQKGRLKIHEILTNLGIKANEDKAS